MSVRAKRFEVEADGHTVEISNPEKVLFPDVGLTKRDLADYYYRIAETMLPYVEGRPVHMHRFPDGIDGEGFHQKRVPDHFPSWIGRAQVPKRSGGNLTHVVCENAATLVYLADEACITPHVWLSRVDRIEHPDQLIFDLDPPGDDFELVCAAARSIRETLEQLHLPAYVKTTGSRGLHVLTPLDRSADFAAVRSFARGVVEAVAGRDPDRLTTEQRKEKRKGRLFLDALRNGYAQTAVPPYAVRARPGGPVAAPLDWDELSGAGLHSARYTTRNIFRRLARKDDPWRGMWRAASSLADARHRLDELFAERPSS
jgi:bifunctional non-homologous end joining protein LigD